MSKEKKISPSYALIAIGVDNFSVANIRSLVKDGISPHENLAFTFNAYFEYIEKSDIIQLLITTTISLIRKKTIPVSEIAITYDFEIEGIDQWKNGNSLVVPAKVARTFISTGYETSRGIIWSKLSDSILRRVIIPVANFEELKQEDLVFSV